MIRAALVLLALAFSLNACGTTNTATKTYRSAAGYTISYPAAWTVRSSTARTFSAASSDDREYVVVIAIDAAPDVLLAAHSEALANVSVRTETKHAATGSGAARELWSTRQERDGGIGIYQQYFLAGANGTLWIQHGCFEAGLDPENASADRDCDDAGQALLNSLRLH